MISHQFIGPVVIDQRTPVAGAWRQCWLIPADRVATGITPPRYLRALVCWLVLACFACRPPVGSTQAGVPLPDDLQAAFSHRTAETLVLTVPEGELSCQIEYRNSDGEDHLTMLWRGTSGFDDPGSLGMVPVSQQEPVSYHITGVCRDSTRDTVFFVCGWVPRSSSVVIERWTLGALTIAATAQPGTRSVLHHLDTPRIRREVLTEFVSRGPCRSIAHVAGSDSLLALTDNGGPVVYGVASNGALSTEFVGDGSAVHLGSGEGPTPLLLPALGSMQHMTAGAHTVHGFLVAMEPYAPWRGEGADSPKVGAQMILLIDQDVSGSFDQVATLPFVDGVQVIVAGSWGP